MKFIPNLAKAKIILPLLVTSLYSFAPPTPPASPAPPAPPATPASPLPITSSPHLPLSFGNQVSLNGQTWSAAWSQWQADAQGRVHISVSDAAITQLLGVELLNTENAAEQPVQWFSQSTPLVLSSWLKGGYRYLDVTDLAQMAGWQLRVLGSTLSITTPVAKVEAIQRSLQSWGERIVINLDRPTPWRKEAGGARGPLWGWGGEGSRGQGGKNIPVPLLPAPFHLLSPTQTWIITIDATLKQPPLTSPAPPSSPTSPPPHLPKSPSPSISPPLNIKATQSQTILQVDVPDGLTPRVTTLPNPNQIAIDFRPDALPLRDILWAPGLRWRQQFVNLDGSRFPVVWLEVNLLASGLKLRPIWSNPNALVGTAPLTQTAQLYTAAAAINGGFFNRHEQLPLGAIRHDGRWLSSPILNRGVIAWNDFGQVRIGRLSFQETLTTSLGDHFPILTLNSGYIQAGIARYTPDWGPTYTPLNNDEIIVFVEHQQVTAQLAGGAAGQGAFPIPPNGYLLVIRDHSAVAHSLPIGTVVSLDTTLSDFARYPQIIGAGPLLIQNQQIVLDAKAEQFSNAFIKETASRSAICTTAPNALLIVAVHNRIGGAGPTLAELAMLLQQMRCVDALNLDGGSSTSLYLGGRLLDRSPSTAARIHNGLGVFLGEMK